MYRNQRYRRFGGPRRRAFAPWRRLQGLLWLVGIIYFLYTGKFWPGILILILLSLLLQGIFLLFIPRQQPDQIEGFPQEAQMPAQPAQTIQPQAQPAPAPQPAQHRVELLPDVCPKCGAPIRGHEVKWTGDQSADCPYCGANLPMNRTAQPPSN